MSILIDISNEDPNLSFSPLSIIDIKQTWTYLSERGDEPAENFILSIIKICKMIAENPFMGRDRSELIVGLRQLPFNTYNIFYLSTETGVEIYRVLHSSRDTVQIFEELPDQPN